MASSNARAFRQVGAFRTKLEGADRLLMAQSKEMRVEVLKLIDEGFQKRVDPIGRRWARRKRRYPWPILNRTLALRRGWRGASAGKAGTDFTNRVPYTRYHQTGTWKMKARKMVPDERLSPRWRRRLMKVWNHTNAKYWGYGG